MKSTLLIIILGFTLTNLFALKEHEKTHLKDYYFPYRQLIHGAKYTFVNSIDSSEKYYWDFAPQVKGGDTIIIIRVRDAKLRLTEEVTQKVTENGLIMLSYIIFDYRENVMKKRDCMVLDSMIFKWDQKIEDSINWRVSYIDSTYMKPFQLNRVRIFSKFDTLGLVKFKDYYYVKVGVTQILDHQVSSYYQRNKGLVKYTILYRNGITKLFNIIEPD
jgi:hypothetical protein